MRSHSLTIGAKQSTRAVLAHNATVVIVALGALALPGTVAADEVYFRLVDVEIKYLDLWEEPAEKSTVGNPPNTADVFVDVEVNHLAKMKIGIYDQVSNAWLATTVYTPSSYGDKIWSPTINVPTVAKTLGVYV